MQNNNFNINNLNTPNSAVNLGGTVEGDQNVTQNNYTTNPQLETALQDLKNTLAELQKQHPNVTQEAEAIEIIEAEIAELSPVGSKLSLLWQQLLNPKRHLQASKAGVMEMAKHYLDESAFGKGAIAYLDTLSSKPEQGA